LGAGFAVGRSSALGRWFDAASALLGIRTLASFEAEPAIELQKLAENYAGAQSRHGVTPLQTRDWAFQVLPGEPTTIDFPDLDEIAQCAGEDIPRLALAFHSAVASATAQVAGQLAASAGTKRVIASGGCFLNALLDRLLAERFSDEGLQYLKPELPPGDQAIALGQIGLVLSSVGK
jgi:hydrogenase maturation protein HypF